MPTRPTFHLGIPWWFHSNADKLDVVYELSTHVKLVLASKSAFIDISPDDTFGQWLITWRLKVARKGWVRDFVVLSTQELEYAFGLKHNWTAADVIFIADQLFNPEGSNDESAVSMGKFIRYRQYLTLPGPGWPNYDMHPGVSLDAYRWRDTIRGMIKTVEGQTSV